MRDNYIDLLESESCDFNNRFLKNFIDIIIHSTRPTRITQHNATLIDNVFYYRY